ncbi:MAG: hypothetical protein NPINA01_11650 [Nitrospinaceae bacterium]|nr:MAG: hypothetical protein NPINA01_11650 [Nitrospinaceae bacterium]
MVKYHMWKNVFIESCILSALIFGGFYFNAALLKDEISTTQETFHNESQDQSLWTHISGFDTRATSPEDKKKAQAHFSGNSTPVNPVDPISGATQPSLATPE